MFLKEVGKDKGLIKLFLEFPVALYATDANWIRPLNNDIEAIFDPRKNSHFANGEAIRWVLLNESDEVIGRVAAFYMQSSQKKDEMPVGGMGFFECIEDFEAATCLFNACKEWLSIRGLEAMDGPINFGERDSFWGLMVKGWEFEPTYKMPWTKPYYISFFEDYGFEDYFQQYVYVSSIRGANVTQAIEEKAERIFQNPAYQFRHIEKSNLAKYAEDFKLIFNAAWAKFPGVKAMSSEQAQKLVKQMKPIIDEQLLWFAYSEQGDPVAFFIVIPDLNQIVKHLNGKLNTWGMIKFLLLKWRGALTRTCGVIFGVVPEHQGKGVESAIALRFRTAARENPFYPYTTMDMNWVGDFNPKMMRFVSQLGATNDKTYITYRYIFNPNTPFSRCPKVG
jgi:GNAT superfamily N-acetyltransferase